MNSIDLTFWLNQVPAEIAQDHFSLRLCIVTAAICMIATIVCCIVAHKEDIFELWLVALAAGAISIIAGLSACFFWCTIIQLQQNPQMWALHRFLDRLQ